MDSSRRIFLKTSLAAGAFAFLPFRFAWPAATERAAGAQRSARPLQDLSPSQLYSLDFNGDDIERTHEILWNVDGFIKKRGGLPSVPSEEASVVIVGGGMAGLYAAYQMRDLDPILLEQDKAFGGNSKGEKYGTSRFSIGAAYITVPEETSEIGKLLKELDLWKKGRQEGSTTVFFQGRFAQGFWEGSTDPEARKDFLKVHETLKAVYDQLQATVQEDAWQQSLDSISFEQWLKETFGTVHPHVLEYVQLYAWSSFAASIDELSALQMLGFIAAETAEIMTFPGGNAAITDRLYTRLVSRLGANRLRPESLVVDIRCEGESVLVTYAGPDEVLKTIRARACIFASPKFVAKKVLRDLPVEQLRAIEQIRYRGYVVANVLLDRALPAPSYELYCLRGELPPTPTAMNKSNRPFTDVVFGSWAQEDKTKNSVLTVYKAFAFDGDRQFLFHPGSHDKHKGRILEGLKPVIEALGIPESAIAGVRMTRWGHSLPVAATGLISSGVLARAHQPIQNRIFFANQDNWANPCFETAIAEAAAAVESVRVRLAPARAAVNG